MVTRIFKSGWFQRFARKEKLSDGVLSEAAARANHGLVDADLGGGVIKQRVARPGAGRSGGYRTLILFKRGELAVFAFGFAKSARNNISPPDLAVLKDAAREASGWSNEDLDRLVAGGALMEIDDDQD